MEHTKKIVQREDRGLLNWLGLMVVPSLLFVSFVLLPFARRATTTIYQMASSISECPPGKACSSHNYIGWLRPSGVQAIEIYSVLALALFGVVALWYTRRPNQQRLVRHMASIHLAVTVLVIVGTVLTYGLIRTDSQATSVSAYNLALQAQRSAIGDRIDKVCLVDRSHLSPVSNVQLSTQCAQMLAVDANLNVHIGYGIAPAYLILESALYLAVPLLNWYRFALSPRYVGGQKKDALFQ